MDESAADIAELWRDYKEGGTSDARERLILHYSPLVKFVAGRVAAGLPRTSSSPTSSATASSG